MLTKIDHIGIAVRTLEEALPFYTETLGLRCIDVRDVPQQGVKVAFIPIGDTELELLEPLGPDTPVGKFIENQGPGLHHVCFDTPEVAGQLTRLKECGMRMLDEVPKEGAVGMIGFMHPKSGLGVLWEFSTRFPGMPPSGER
jgi:methylmalonyl-CoA/ethylmalonyl-CoA epimerase